MNTAIYGYGTMGKFLVESVNKYEGMTLAGVVDDFKDFDEEFVYRTFEDVPNKIDVIIDFSHPSNLDKVLTYAIKTKTPVLIATTGLTEDDYKKIDNASKEIAVLTPTNTSLGVNLLNELMKYIVPVLADTYDIEVIEKHHNKKLDSPSGTAKTLIEKIQNSLPEPRTLVHGRDGMAKREKQEIGVHAVRGGSIVGEHSVIFAGEDEIIEIKHEAISKKIFSNGACKGAAWLVGKPAGYYEMKEVLGL